MIRLINDGSSKRKNKRFMECNGSTRKQVLRKSVLSESMFGKYEQYATVSHEFGNSEFTSLLPKSMIADLNWKLSVAQSLANMVNDNDGLIYENNTKVYSLFNGDFEEDEWDEDIVRTMLENEWDYFTGFAKEKGIDLEIRDGRNSPYYYIDTPFLNALRDVSGGRTPVDAEEVLNAMVEAVFGSCNKAIYTSDEELNHDIEIDLNDNYDRNDDIADCEEIANYMLDEILDMSVEDVKEIVKQTISAIEVINYAESAKDNMGNVYRDYLNNQF